ncbi:MAG: DNA-methyltransferase [Promethearchaeota archaeon]
MTEKSKNTIICGDATEILSKFPSNFIDLTITSPPYDKLRNYEGFNFNFEELAKQLYRILKEGGVLVWIIGDATVKGSETGSSFRQALFFKEIGFNLHDTMIYQKSGFSNPSKNRYHQIFEYMFVLSKGKPKTFNPIKDKKNKTQYSFSKKRRKKDGTMTHQNDRSRIEVQPYGMRFNIWRYVTGRGNTTKDSIAFEHPALFPEKLVRDHIISWSNEGDIILDPMNGSGTTTKMAYLLKRNFIGIDISEKYCEIARKRLILAQKQRESKKYYES